MNFPVRVDRLLVPRSESANRSHEAVGRASAFGKSHNEPDLLILDEPTRRAET